MLFEKMFGKYFLSTKYFVNIKGAAFSNDYIKGTAFLVNLFGKIICGAFFKDIKSMNENLLSHYQH